MNVAIPGGIKTNASLQPRQAAITETEMIRPRLLTLAVGLAVVLSSVARADELIWGWPEPRIFAQSLGKYAIKTLPAKSVGKRGSVLW